MNDSLKQRLVGAIVLSCIALILWPVIFSAPGGPSVDRRSQIPAVPEFNKYTVPEATRPANIEPVPAAKIAPATVAPAEPATAPAAADKPGQDPRGLPESWVLQVASFSKAANAKELTEALQKQGYKAFSREIVTTEGRATRVYIGPKFTKEAFRKDKPRIDKAFNVKSIIMPFEP